MKRVAFQGRATATGEEVQQAARLNQVRVEVCVVIILIIYHLYKEQISITIVNFSSSRKLRFR